MLTSDNNDIFKENSPPQEDKTDNAFNEVENESNTETESELLARLPISENSPTSETHVNSAAIRGSDLTLNRANAASGHIQSSIPLHSISLSGEEERPNSCPVKMKVESNFRGNEGLRSITYFLIRTTTEKIISPPSGVEAAAMPPKTVPPHLRSLFSGLGLVQWQQGKEVMIQRRYSEACALRELLLYQFPHLIIPPLRVKGIGENWDSYLNREDASCELSVKLQFFFQQLVAIPEVVFMSDFFKSFATDPRDAFEVVTLPRITEKIKAYQRANKVVVDFSGQQKEFTSSATNAIVNASTKTIKSVINFFTGYRTGGDNVEEKSGNSNSFVSAPATGATATSSLNGASLRESPATGGMSVGTGVNSLTESGNNSAGEGSRLGGYSGAAEVTADIDYWNNVSVFLAITRKHLKEAAANFNQYLSHTNKAETAMLTAAEAAKSFSSELRSFGQVQSTAQLPSSSSVPSSNTATEANLLPRVSEGFEALSYNISETVEIRRNKRRQQFVDVCSRLRCETDYIKSVLFRVDDILSLYSFVKKANAYECMSPTWIDAIECAREISRHLREGYEKMYLPKYNSRMCSLKRKVFLPMHDVADELLKYRQNSSTTAFIHRFPSGVVQEAVEGMSEPSASSAENLSTAALGIVEF